MSLIPRKTLPVIGLTMIIAMLIIGLWPFNYYPPNRVSPTDRGSGIRFSGRGIALSRGGTDLLEGILPDEPVTLELRLQPERTFNRRISRILSLCDRTGREVVSLGQWRTYLIIRLMDSSGWLDRVKRQAGFKDLLIPGKPVLITIVFAGEDMAVYADGSLVRRYSDFELGETLADRPVRSLVLGNSSLADKPWRGEISGFSVFNAKLDDEAVRNSYDRWSKDGPMPSGMEEEIIFYRFDDFSDGIVRNEAGKQWDLLVPNKLTPLRRELLSLPNRDFFGSHSFYFDAAVNLFGFIPFGLLGAWLLLVHCGVLRHLCIALPAMAGGLLSLVIEVNQAFLVTRNSSITDLVLNTLGATVGAFCVVAYSSRRTSGNKHR